MTTEISNAPPGFPTHSPEGYALEYALGLDGQPAPGTSAYFKYDGQVFPSTDEIEVYKARMVGRKERIAKQEREADVAGVGFETMRPELISAILGPYDRAATTALKFWKITGPEMSALRNRGMALNELNNMVGRYNSGSMGGPNEAPEGWEGSEVQAFRSGKAPVDPPIQFDINK
jgi:hypothetical protein